MNSSHLSEIERYAHALVAGAAMELHLTPKPGLVDLADNGSHPDLSIGLMERSLHYISGYMDELIRSLSCGEPFAEQAKIGLRTEKTMLSALGTNTHKGYIFLSGLFLVARRHGNGADERRFRVNIASIADGFFREKSPGSTNGQRARSLYKAGGIIREAIDGFPSLFEEAVPAYLEAAKRCGCRRTASFAMMGRLMQCLEDTTALHRCGQMGLARIRRDGRLIEKLAADGDDCAPFIEAINKEYIRMGLTMGGVADMMGLSYAYLLASTESKPDSLRPFALTDYGGVGISMADLPLHYETGASGK
jgi:triphosphoribosyl-dephospho-CoA synthetase